MNACRALSYGEGFLSGMLGFLDCQARTLGWQGYQALAAPGSPISTVLTALLTLFIAFHGYRLLLGHVPTVREGVLAMVKIGAVLTLATSWPAYRILVYDLVLHAPAELASQVGRSVGLPGSNGGLIGRLQAVDDNLATLGVLGTGAAATQDADPEAAPPENATVAQRTAARRPSSFDPTAFHYARVLYLCGAIGALGAVWLGAGLLLALGPFFAGFLLFGATRGLFLGWVRALTGTALASIAIRIVLGAELGLIEYWIAELVGRRYAQLSVAGAPAELLTVSLVVLAILACCVFAAFRVAFSLQFPPAWRDAPRDLAQALRSASDRAPPRGAAR